MNFLKVTFVFVFIALFQSATYAQEWVSYQTQGQINDLVDKGNELLLATDLGLVVVNKSNLEKSFFNKANSSLSTNHIQSIIQAPNGQSWIGTYDAILERFDGTGFQEMVVPELEEYDPQTTKLYDFKIAPNGDFWLATSDGVFHRQNQDWLHYGKEELGASFFEAWDIEIDDAGAILIASRKIHKYINGVWSNMSDTTQLFGYSDAEIFFSTSGDLFFAGDLDRLGRYDGQTWHEYEVEDLDDNLNGGAIVGFTEDLDGNIYFNTLDQGIFKFENNTWVQQMDAQTEAFNNNTSFFHIDEQNKRWLNNNIHLSVNDNGNIQSSIISPNTIEFNKFRRISKDEDGRLYFISAQNDNVSVLDPDGNWSFFQAPDNLSLIENIRDIFVIANNDIWLATDYGGIYHYDGVAWTLVQEGLFFDSFISDSQGKIYARSATKIIAIENGVLTEYNSGNSPLAFAVINCHGVDANDALWVGSNSENIIQKRSSDGTWTTYTGEDHPAINQPQGDFHFDQEGNLWVPSRQNGVIKFDGENWTNPILDNEDEITNTSVFSIESDIEGKLYFSHHHGITTMINNEWENVLIEDVPVNIIYKSTIQLDDDGTLWWASNEYGVFSYTPEATSSTFAATEINTNFSVFPNPAQQYTTLDFEILEKANVNIFIYNNLGQLQSSLNLGQLSPGSFQQVIDLSRTPKGFYSIQLQINDKRSAKALILQ